MRGRIESEDVASLRSGVRLAEGRTGRAAVRIEQRTFGSSTLRGDPPRGQEPRDPAHLRLARRASRSPICGARTSGRCRTAGSRRAPGAPLTRAEEVGADRRGQRPQAGGRSHVARGGTRAPAPSGGRPKRALQAPTQEARRPALPKPRRSAGERAGSARPSASRRSRPVRAWRSGA